MPIKILMVCLGNICRSPVAEGIMRNKIEKYKLDAIVDSAGTSNYHIGEHPDLRSIANAQKNGIDISNLCARQIVKQDFDIFDFIFVMDANNYNDVIKLAENNTQKSKVNLLLNAFENNENSAVPDPYYSNENGFETVFKLINESCEKIALNLLNNNKYHKI